MPTDRIPFITLRVAWNAFIDVILILRMFSTLYVTREIKLRTEFDAPNSIARNVSRFQRRALKMRVRLTRHVATFGEISFILDYDLRNKFSHSG